MTIILLTMLLLMAFAIVTAKMGFPEMGFAAGTGVITLVGEFVRRLLSFTRTDNENTDTRSVISLPAPKDDPFDPPLDQENSQGNSDARTA
ncbi:hypothetical protein [Dactylosporangium sp. NPDC006015]|uniref:hypothetical protein n=1 Tax=Dactylosporangium sp. NPDC006015 TaxID=3154576 RepID=UPI0033A51ECF